MCKRLIHQSNKKRAVEFWKPDDTMKPRSLNSIKHRFRKVKSLRQLRKWKEQINRGSRMEKLKEISSYTLEKFQKSLQKGIAIHDIDIIRWAFKVQEKINLPGFTASLSKKI